MVLGKLDSHMQNNETYIIFKKINSNDTALNKTWKPLDSQKKRKFLDVLTTGDDSLNLTLKAKTISVRV